MSMVSTADSRHPTYQYYQTWQWTAPCPTAESRHTYQYYQTWQWTAPCQWYQQQIVDTTYQYYQTWQWTAPCLSMVSTADSRHYISILSNLAVDSTIVSTAEGRYPTYQYYQNWQWTVDQHLQWTSTAYTPCINILSCLTQHPA